MVEREDYEYEADILGEGQKGGIHVASGYPGLACIKTTGICYTYQGLSETRSLETHAVL